MAGQGRHGLAGEAGQARQGRAGLARRGLARHGKAGQGRRGKARQGKAGQARQGEARRGKAGQGRRGKARQKTGGKMSIDTTKINRAIAAAYKRGESPASIAAVYDISQITVRARLRDMGIPIRAKTHAWRGGNKHTQEVNA